MLDNLPVVLGGGAIVSVMGTALVLLVGMARRVPANYQEQIESQQTTIDQQGRLILALREDSTSTEMALRKANRRTDMMIRACQLAGVEIPAGVWD